MKVYTHIVMDMTQLDVPVIEEHSYEYDGELMLCSGGGGGSDSGAPDSYYNKKANIAEQQQNIATEQWNWHKYGQAEAPETKTEYKVDGTWMDEDSASNWVDSQNKKVTESTQSPNYRSPNDYQRSRMGLTRNDMQSSQSGSDKEKISLGDLESRTRNTDKGNFSQLDLERMKLKDNKEILPLTTDLKKSNIGLQQDKISAAQSDSIWGDGLSGWSKDYKEAVAEHANEANWKGQSNWTPDKFDKKLGSGYNWKEHYDKYGNEVEDTVGKEFIDPDKISSENRFTQQARLEKDRMDLKRNAIAKKQGILDDMGGLGIDSRMNQAEADVKQQFMQNQKEAERSLSRYGIDPSSGKFQDMESDFALEKASAEAGARNKARNRAKNMGLNILGG